MVRYQIATYSGDVEVSFDDPDADNEHLIALARAKLRRKTGPFPLGLQSFRVVSRSEA